MPVTTNMSLVMPTEGGSNDIWDTILNTLFGVVDAHDHTTGKGVQVPSTGLKINADVAWAFGGTSYSITSLKAVDFTPVTAASVAALAGAFFVSSADNELYFRSIAGSNIKITNSGALNVSIVGGIGGDYSSISALFSYDDASHSYWAQQETIAAVRKWASLRVGNVDIYEAAASITNRVRLNSPSALAASYALTLPAALPASTVALQCSSAGVLSASNNFADVGYSTAQALLLDGSLWLDSAGSHTRFASTKGFPGWTLAASANVLVMPLPVIAGDTITGYGVSIRKRTNGSATVTVRMYKFEWATGTETALGTGVTDAENAPGYITLVEAAMALTVVSGFAYYLAFTPSGSVTSNADNLFGARLSRTRAV